MLFEPGIFKGVLILGIPHLYPDDAVSIGVSWSLSATDRGSPGRAGRAPAQGARANGGRGRRGGRGRFGGLGLLPDLEDLDLDGHGLGTWITAGCGLMNCSKTFPGLGILRSRREPLRSRPETILLREPWRSMVSSLIIN